MTKLKELSPGDFFGIPRAYGAYRVVRRYDGSCIEIELPRTNERFVWDGELSVELLLGEAPVSQPQAGRSVSSADRTQ